MKDQLHTFRGGVTTFTNTVTPVVNKVMFNKPRNGLWTSTYSESVGSRWMDWCIGESFSVPENGVWKGVILTPAADAKVLVIDSAQDLAEVLSWAAIVYPEFSVFGSFIDFEKVATKYDAINLTHEGQRRTRFVDYGNMYGWDCESTIWFRWKFDSVRPVTLTTEGYEVKQIEYGEVTL